MLVSHLLAFVSLFMWVQPESTRKLYICLWVAFISSCVLPYKLMGFMIGEAQAPSCAPAALGNRAPRSTDRRMVIPSTFLSFPPCSRRVRGHQILYHRLPVQELPKAAGQIRHPLHRVEQPPHGPSAQREDQRHCVATGKKAAAAAHAHYMFKI